MWLGDTPPIFLLEIAFRTAVMYVWLLLLLRVVGRRGLAQLSVVEFAIVIALGSAVGDPMFYPEVPLVHGMVVVLIVVALHYGVALLINKSEHVETFMEGRPVCLVENGRVDLRGLRHVSLSTEELFERLRLAGVEQLGEVRFAFMEQGGNMSLFRFKQPRPGLPIVPPFDLKNLDKPVTGGVPACVNCGEVREDADAPCPRCGERRALPATLDPLPDAG